MFKVAAVAIRRQKTKALVLIGLLGVVLSATIGTLPTPAIAATGINKTINFQGKVVNTNGTNVANGSYTFVFKLYSVASAGTANWTESKSLTVTDGVFQTNLGDVTSLPGSVDFNTDNIFMGITFSTDAEMSPRIQFTAAAYAFNSDRLGGIAAAGFGQLNPASAQTGSLNVTGTVQAATSLQAPLVDTATGVALNIGTSTQTSLTLGRSGAAFTLQGSSTSTIKATSGGFTSTLGFVTPTANNVISLPNEAGTLCIQNSVSCGFLTGATSDYVQNTTTQQATSNFNISGIGVAAVALQAPLHATADSAAAGTANITLRTGNVTGGSTLSSGNVTIKSGDGTGTNTSTGNVSVDTGAKSGSGFAGNLNIGTTNAANVTIGHNGATPSTVSIQGAAATSALIMSNAAGTFSSTVAFANPTATTTTTISNAGGTVCTTVSSTCSGTYLVTGSYLAKNAADTSSAGVAGYLLGLTNTSGNVLQLTGAGTGSAFSVTQSGNPVAGSAVIFANNTNGTPSGNLIDLQAASVSKFSVTSGGAVTAASTINSQTISATAQFTGTVTSANTVTVQAGGIAVTGNSSITGTLGVSSNVTVSAGNLTLSSGTLSVTSAAQNSITGSLKLTGGLDNQSGGITNAGAVSGATTVTASSTIIGGGAFKSADAASTSAVTLMSGNASAGTSGNVTVDAGTATSTTGTVNVGTSNAAAINIGNATAPVTVQGSSASKLVFGNSTVSAVSSATAATYQFAAPTSATTYNICTSDAGSCTGTFLRKNIVGETSSAGLAAAQYLYQFTNTGSATADVLQLASGTGTGSGLKVTAAANAAAGNALVFAKLTNASIGGNLLDLWSGVSGSETSKFAVAASGAVSSGTINGQTLGATSQLAIVNTSGLLTANTLTVSNAANFNGAATITGLLTANGGATVTGGIANNAGGITGAGAVSGLTSLQFNTNGTIDTNAANTLTIGGINANTITIGKNTATQPTISLQGGNGSTFSDTNGANSTTLAFLAPGVASKTVSIPNETGTICTSAASSNATCSNFAPATLGTGYIQNQIGAQQSASNFWISATGRADASILTPLLDAATAGGSVAIGTTNATAGVNINQNTTLASGKSLTLQGALTQSGGTISLAGNGASQIVTTAGNALTITSATAATWSTGAGVLTVQGFGGTTINSPNASGAATGGLTVQSGNVTSGAFASGSIGIDVGSSTGTTGTINLGVTSASAISIGHTGITTTTNGTNQVGASAGTGALVNNGSTVNTTYVMANLATGGWDAGGAAVTVDKYTYVSAVQTTAGQTLVIPAPTANTAYGRLLYLTNTGSASFTLLTTTIGAGSTATLIWANNTVGGAAWTFAGADGSGVLNQNAADQTANFRISGTGRANTSVITPLVDSISGGLNLGTATATGVTIGGTTNTTGITLQGAAGVTITIGNAAGSGVLTNNGATINSTLALGNFAAGGSIGTAAATVDIYTSISVSQTTANQTLTIPTPTANTKYGRLLYLSNVGTTGYNLGGVRIPPGNTATLVWSNTNGAASWQFAGAGATSIENQNTSNQAADFRISGSGQANTSFLTPALDVASAGTLSLGTTTATGITIGNTANTTAITLQVTSTGTITLGGELTVNTATNVIQIGSGTSNNGTTVLALNNNNGTVTPTEVDGGMYYNNSTSQFLCGENGFWVNCGVPPRDHSYDLYDEFMSGNSGTLATGAYGIGGLNWYNSLIGAPGALTYNNNSTGGNAPAASANRPGIIDIRQTGTGNGTGQTMSLGLASTLLGTSMVDFKTAVNITGGNLTTLIGLHNETTAVTAPTTGVYWKEAGNGLWQYCYANATPAETCANSAVTATAGSWARLEIVIVSSSEIDYFINGTEIAVTGITYNTTNMVAPAYTSYKTTGTPGTLDIYIDYFELLGTTSTAR